MADFYSKSVGLYTGDTKMKVLIQEDNADALVLLKKFPPQLNTHINNYATNTICFCGEILKCESGY